MKIVRRLLVSGRFVYGHLASSVILKVISLRTRNLFNTVVLLSYLGAK